MSKGYGVWQRLLMNKSDSLNKEDYFYLVDLLPLRHKSKDYQALNRAAKALRKAGKLNLSYAGGLAVHHVGTEIKLVIDRGKRPPAYYKCILRDKSSRKDTYER